MNDHNSPPGCNHKHSDKHESQIEKGRTLFITTLIIAAFVIGTAITIIVEICRTWLPVPRDTEIGVMAVVAVVTLFAIIGQIMVNALQWDASRNQWKVMQEQGRTMQCALRQTEEHFKVLNRPILNIDKIKWLQDAPHAGMEAGKHWRVMVVLRNYGGMIAHTVLNDATLKPIPNFFVDDPCPEPIRTVNRAKSLEMAVASRSTFTVTLEIPKLSEEDVFGLWSDDIREHARWKRVALWIDLTYTDDFGNSYDFRYHALFNRAAFVPCRNHCEAT